MASFALYSDGFNQNRFNPDPKYAKNAHSPSRVVARVTSQNETRDSIKPKTKPQKSNVHSNSSKNLWSYTNINNVKVVYNAQDAKNHYRILYHAKDYIRSLADIWEIGNYRGGNKFIHEILRKIDHITENTERSFEYFINESNETGYILLVIERKENRTDIGYSFHHLTNKVFSGDSNGDNIFFERKSLEWFRTKARKSLKIPANIVSDMIYNNSSASGDYESESSYRQPHMKISATNNPQQPHNNEQNISNSGNTMDCEDDTVLNTQRGRNNRRVLNLETDEY